VSLREGSPRAEKAVALEGARVGYHDDVLPAHVLLLQLGPFHLVVARSDPQDARQGGVLSPSGDDVGVLERLDEVLQLPGSCG